MVRDSAALENVQLDGVNLPILPDDSKLKDVLRKMVQFLIDNVKVRWCVPIQRQVLR